MVEVVVGRSAEADYSIAHDSLSRRHCRIIFESDAVWVEDLHSSNGTTLEGKRLEQGERVRVPPHAEVTLADEVVLDWAFLQSLKDTTAHTSEAVSPWSWPSLGVNVGRLKERASQPAAFGGLAALVCVIGILAYYLTFVIPAGHHDEKFAELRSRYQSRAQPVMTSPSSVEEVATFLNSARSILTTTKDSLYPRYEQLMDSKNFVRALSSRPTKTETDYRAFYERVQGDVRGLIRPLNTAVQNEHRRFRSAVESGDYTSVDELKSALEDHLSALRSAQRVYRTLQPYNEKGRKEAFQTAQSNIQQGLDLAEQTRSVLTGVVEAQRSYQQKVKSGLQIVETANKKLADLGSFPHSSTIRETYRHWDRAHEDVEDARSILREANQYDSSFKEAAAGALLADDLERISKLRARINDHRSSLESKYRAAKEAESTLVGSARRALGRTAEDLAQTGKAAAEAAANSRVGQQLDFGVKSMILGTNILFDLANIDEATDLAGMAQKYQDDLSQLAEERREIRRMEGPGVTDLSSFTEELVEGAYEEALR